MPPPTIDPRLRRIHRVPLMMNEIEKALLEAFAEALDLDAGPALRRALEVAVVAGYGRDSGMFQRYAQALGEARA